MLNTGNATTLNTNVVTDAELRHAQKPGMKPAFIQEQGNEWSPRLRVKSTQ